MADARGRRWNLAALISMLAPAVGNERARAAIQAAFIALSIFEDSVDEEGALRVFAHLQSAGGLTAIAARRAAATLTAKEEQPAARPSAPQITAAPEPAARASGAATVVSRADLVDLLAHAVGRAEATAAIERAASALGFGAAGSAADAQRVLEAIANEPGLVGITARFAKARLALRGK